MLSGPGLFDGFAGLAVYACACARVWPDDDVTKKADALVREATEELRGLCRSIERHAGNPRAGIIAGEGAGLGGILTGIALIRRYMPDNDLDAVRDQLVAGLGRSDFAHCNAPDRITGLAGLVSAHRRSSPFCDGVDCRATSHRGWRGTA